MREGFSTVILLKNGILPKIVCLKINATFAISTLEINKKNCRPKIEQGFFRTSLKNKKIIFGSKIGEFSIFGRSPKTTIWTLHKLYSMHNNLLDIFFDF